MTDAERLTAIRERLVATLTEQSAWKAQLARSGFIAHAPSDIAYLLARVEAQEAALRAIIADAEAGCAHHCGDYPKLHPGQHLSGCLMDFAEDAREALG